MEFGLLGLRSTVPESELVEMIRAAVVRAAGGARPQAGMAAAHETSPPDHREVWDQYKVRFLKVYKGVDEETLLGLLMSSAESVRLALR